MKGVPNFVRTAARHLLRPIRPFLDDFLDDVSGVIHIGASDGQERENYAQRGLEVVWVEAIPRVFDQLQQNLTAFPKQIAINAALGDQDDQEVMFNIASNNGESSSMLAPLAHVVDRPDITFDEQIEVSTVTLETLALRNHLDLTRYGALVIDVQGAELLVLRGGQNILPAFRYIKAEASDGELYEGSCTPEELISYLSDQGFRVQRKVVIATNSTGENIYDIVFRRI